MTPRRARAVAWLAPAAGLAAAWAAAAWLLAPATGGAEAAVTALATLAAVLAHRPLRARLGDVLARRADRDGHAALDRIARFVVAVRAGDATPEAIEDELAAALGDPLLTLRYRLVSSAGHADRHGRAADPAPAAGQVATPVRRRGAEPAVVLHAPALRERPERLHAALGAAGLAIEVARLRVDVAMQVEAARASRVRIAAAELTERAQVREELEHGAGRRLAALDAALARAADELAGADPALGTAVAAAARELDGTRAELHTLAGGVATAALDAGLAAALRELAARMPMPVRVEADAGRAPAEVERTAYFVAAEAVANAIKHAGAEAILVRALVRPDRLELRVADDGRGGATFAPGGGLRGLRDRVEAIGGALALVPCETGTTLEAVLPCAS